MQQVVNATSIQNVSEKTGLKGLVADIDSRSRVFTVTSVGRDYHVSHPRAQIELKCAVQEGKLEVRRMTKDPDEAIYAPRQVRASKRQEISGFETKMCRDIESAHRILREAFPAYDANLATKFQDPSVMRNVDDAFGFLIRAGRLPATLQELKFNHQSKVMMISEALPRRDELLRFLEEPREFSTKTSGFYPRNPELPRLALQGDNRDEFPEHSFPRDFGQHFRHSSEN